MVMRAAAAADTALPQAQILQPASEQPMKVEQTAQFLRGELTRLFTTGVRRSPDAIAHAACDRALAATCPPSAMHARTHSHPRPPTHTART